MSEFPPPVRLGLNEPANFDDIFGHSNAVASLRGRIGRDDRSTGVVLHGPEGVGKRTLARLYAKVALCENPTQDGDACGVCEGCLSFKSTGGMSNIEVEITNQDAERRVQYVIDADEHQPWGKRRIIILVNADKIPPRDFDRLLPTLERAKAPTDFILLTRDLRSVRLAGVSRCEVIGLRPLTSDVADELFTTRLVELGTLPDAQTLDVLVAAGRGLPKRINEMCALLGGLSHLTLSKARQVLGLDWVDDATARCRDLLDCWPATECLLVPWNDVGATEQLRRIQVCLCHAYLHGLRNVPVMSDITDPALLYRENSLQDLAEAFKVCAERHGLPVDDLWCALTAWWLSSDRIEPETTRPPARRGSLT